MSDAGQGCRHRQPSLLKPVPARCAARRRQIRPHSAASRCAILMLNEPTPSVMYSDFALSTLKCVFAQSASGRRQVRPHCAAPPGGALPWKLSRIVRADSCHRCSLCLRSVPPANVESPQIALSRLAVRFVRKRLFLDIVNHASNGGSEEPCPDVDFPACWKAQLPQRRLWRGRACPADAIVFPQPLNPASSP